MIVSRYILFIIAVLMVFKNAAAEIALVEIPYSDSTGRLVVFFSEKKDSSRFFDVSEKLGVCSDNAFYCINGSSGLDISISKKISRNDRNKKWTHLGRCFSLVQVSEIRKAEVYFYITGAKSCSSNDGDEKSHTIFSNKRGIIYYEEFNDKNLLMKQYILSVENGLFAKDK